MAMAYNARVPVRSSRRHRLESSAMRTRMHFLEGRSEISWHKRSRVLKGWISWVWCHVLKQGATCTAHRVRNCIFEGWCFISCHILVSHTEMGWFGRVGRKVGRVQVICDHFGTILWWLVQLFYAVCLMVLWLGAMWRLVCFYVARSSLGNFSERSAKPGGL